jgi:dGTPase
MIPRAAYACDPALSRGRLHFETLGELRGPRTAFQRDRDRIIHSISFRRLRHKTQVFVAPDGDHFRVRLTHSLEVAQIARTMARALGLDEDLTEALALAHDIGHPPFGHAGEDALEGALGSGGASVGGFDHNAQTLRALMLIDSPYPRWAGLNLSWEMLEGLAKHNGPVTSPSWAMAAADAAYPLDLTSHASLEAQVAAISDDIAYDNHDIDDGLRSGILERDALLALPFVAARWDEVRRRYADVAEARLLPELIRAQIGVMVNDVLVETRARVAAAKVVRVDDVRAAGQPLAGFSEAMQADERVLKRFMYDNLYHHPLQLAVADLAREIIGGLFAAYVAAPENLPESWRASLPADEPARTRHIGDFIAGMTDRYAAARYRELVGPVDLPEGF